MCDFYVILEPWTEWPFWSVGQPRVICVNLWCMFVFVGPSARTFYSGTCLVGGIIAPRDGFIPSPHYILRLWTLGRVEFCAITGSRDLRADDDFGLLELRWLIYVAGERLQFVTALCHSASRCQVLSWRWMIDGWTHGLLFASRTVMIFIWTLDLAVLSLLVGWLFLCRILRVSLVLILFCAGLAMSSASPQRPSI